MADLLIIGLIQNLKNMNNLIISNLSKTYSNGVKALDGITLDIPTGMFGILGPNGAGKSSLMRALATLQGPDQGTVTLGNLNLLTQKDELRRVLGYLPQEFGLYPKISAEVLLNHLAVLKGIGNKGQRKELVQSLLHRTNLYQSRKKNLNTYSGGMKQRFGIAQALLANPNLLIVDEPTAGLYPMERNRFYNLLSELGENAVVILSTHIVEDVNELCSNMAILNNGKVLLKGKPGSLIEQLHGKIYRKQVHTNEVKDYFNRYQVISETRLHGKPIIHIYSEKHPANGFAEVVADLENVYFSQLNKA